MHSGPDRRRIRGAGSLTPCSFAEVRGRVVETVTGEAALASINAMAQKYTGADYAPQIQSERVILKIEPDRQISR